MIQLIKCRLIKINFCLNLKKYLKNHRISSAIEDNFFRFFKTKFYRFSFNLKFPQKKLFHKFLKKLRKNDQAIMNRLITPFPTIRQRNGFSFFLRRKCAACLCAWVVTADRSFVHLGAGDARKWTQVESERLSLVVFPK